MKRIGLLLTIIVIILMLTACSTVENRVYVLSTYAQTNIEVMNEKPDTPKLLIRETFSEMSDGTWTCGGNTYKYKLEITGRLHNAVKDTTYIILSNTEDISFEQAWKASGLSSNTNDYFDPEDAIIVGRII